MDEIVLCADSLTLRYPELMGLEGESVGSLEWLATFAKAEEVRSYLKGAPGPREVWVNSADDMDAINVAAALKRDRPDHEVVLAGQEVSGSIMSRAQAAGIAVTLSREGFAQRYAAEKARRRESAGPLAEGLEPARRANEGQSAGLAPRDGALAGEGSLASAGTVGPLRQSPVTEADWASLAEAASGDPKGARAARPGSSAAGVPGPSATGAMPAVAVVGSAPSEGVAPSGAAGPASLAALSSPDGSAPGERSPRPARRAAHGRTAAVLAVVSGSGGSGKSAVSVASAYLAAARGLRVLLLDCDLQFGDCALLTGAQRPLSIDRVLADPSLLEKAQPEPGVPLLVAAPPRLEQAEVLGGRLPGLMEEASLLFDLVVANTGASWAEYHAQLLEASTASLFLVDQRLSSVRACQRALDLCARCGIATGSFLYAVNRCARNGLFTSIDVSCALGGAPVVELKDGGPEVEELLGAGLAAELAGAKSAFCDSIEEVLDRVLAGHGAAASPRASEGSPAHGGRGGGRMPRRRRKHAKAAGRRGGLGGEGRGGLRAQLPFAMDGGRP